MKLETIKNGYMNLDLSEKKPDEHKDPESNNWTNPLWTARIKLKKLEKKNRKQIKTVELCRTRTKKSSLDMLNFYVVSAGRDRVTDTDRSTTCRSKFQARSLQTNTKIEGPHENKVSPNDRLKISERKKFQNNSALDIFETTQWNTKALNGTVELGSCNQKEINYFFEKGIQIEAVKTSATLLLVRS